MSYQIFGRAIKNEYLALGTLLTTVGVALSASGGKKDTHVPASGSGKPTLEQVKDTVKYTASSSEEEEFIKKFIAGRGERFKTLVDLLTSLCTLGIITLATYNPTLQYFLPLPLDCVIFSKQILCITVLRLFARLW
ncbi:hypothetical protein QCA50_013811 [Cerrena zonata]|uniref:Uncharacterized protein n=1 Tax=Cerrena zonata TaxID=2478898 RepID=A0AAW0FN83_9APHY